jgi:hypothetical protein
MFEVSESIPDSRIVLSVVKFSTEEKTDVVTCAEEEVVELLSNGDLIEQSDLISSVGINSLRFLDVLKQSRKTLLNRVRL